MNQTWLSVPAIAHDMPWIKEGVATNRKHIQGTCQLQEEQIVTGCGSKDVSL